jgi:SAM-dependent methyltransferase
MREEVRLKYAESALGLREECCDVTGGLYTDDEISSLPEAAASSSLGCGNPTAVAELREGETVLDLGSGGGIDVILSARRVGTSGFAYGVDMTEEMLELARKNAREAGVGNVEFLEGLIEDIPLEAETVDVIISNCVINLAVDKPAVFAEMYRVLRPGGRIGISDIVADDSLTREERAERGSWVGCIAGALSTTEYRAGLAEVGFSDVTLTPTHDVAEGMTSMIIRATKPS